MNKRRSVPVSLVAISACFLWSTAFFNVKIGLRFAPPLFFAALRFMLAGIILIPFCGNISNYFKTIRIHLKTIFLLSFFQTFLLYGLFNIGMTMVSGATGAIIIGASPLLAALVAHFAMLDDQITRSKSFSIFLGILGVLIISIHKQTGFWSGSKELPGILFLVTGGILSAIGDVIVAKNKRNINPWLLNSSQLFIGGFLLLLISLPLEGRPNLALPFIFYAVLFWLAIISAVAISLWFILLQREEVKVSELNIWKFIVPVLGATLSWLILPDELPSLQALLGMALVAVSILISNLPNIGNKKKA